MSSVPANIFREYDIRGIADTDLSSENVRLIAQAYGTFLVSQGVCKATVGGDVRLSTERIAEAVIDGMRSAGVDVTDLGIVSTPCFYWSLHHFGLEGGVMITGSHNPKEFNGLKLAFGKVTFFGDEIQEIRRIIDDGRIKLQDKKGTYEKADIKALYLDMLVDHTKLGPRKLKVVVDSGNGTGGMFGPEYMRRIGCDVIELFSEPDGRFPNHHPDPTKRESLTYLIDAVLKNKADLGVGFDGDSDRIGVVDEKGNVIWGDQLMLLYWTEILPKHPGADVIIEVKCSMTLAEAVEKLGGKPIWWKSGHSLIKAKMKEVNSLFTGEMSGHMFFADEYYGFDDAFYAAGRLLRIMSNTDKTLSELLSPFPSYPSTAETRIDCPDDIKFGVVDAVRNEALKDHEAITVDGVRILYPGGWGLIRPSNTQPVLVARCEGRTKEDLDMITADVKARMMRAGVADFRWEY